MRREGAKLFAKTSNQNLYAMIDELVENKCGLGRKVQGKSKVHRDVTVKTAAVAA
jgi:ribosome-associated translation inhibitor RaiA